MADSAAKHTVLHEVAPIWRDRLASASACLIRYRPVAVERAKKRGYGLRLVAHVATCHKRRAGRHGQITKVHIVGRILRKFQRSLLQVDLNKVVLPLTVDCGLPTRCQYERTRALLDNFSITFQIRVGGAGIPSATVGIPVDWGVERPSVSVGDGKLKHRTIIRAHALHSGKSLERCGFTGNCKRSGGHHHFVLLTGRPRRQLRSIRIGRIAFGNTEISRIVFKVVVRAIRTCNNCKERMYCHT